MKKHHYVYRSYEEHGRDYIGTRSCNCLPEQDTKYLGSFTDKTFNPTGKVILFVCETRKEALEIEIELHAFFDVAVNPQFANLAKATSTKFDTTGTVGLVGELNPMFGKKRPDSSERLRKRTGELNPMFGKKNPGVSERNRKRTGELHPMYGKTGELNPMFGKKRPDQSERMRLRTGELHPNFGTKWWVNSDCECCLSKEPPGPEWQRGKKWK